MIDKIFWSSVVQLRTRANWRVIFLHFFPFWKTRSPLTTSGACYLYIFVFCFNHDEDSCLSCSVYILSQQAHTLPHLCPSLCCVTAHARGRWFVYAGRRWPRPGPGSRWSPRWWRTRTCRCSSATDGTRCALGWCPSPAARRNKEKEQTLVRPEFIFVCIWKSLCVKSVFIYILCDLLQKAHQMYK